jgi:hypothetical protein
LVSFAIALISPSVYPWPVIPSCSSRNCCLDSPTSLTILSICFVSSFLSATIAVSLCADPLAAASASASAVLSARSVSELLGQTSAPAFGMGRGTAFSAESSLAASVLRPGLRAAAAPASTASNSSITPSASGALAPSTAPSHYAVAAAPGSNPFSAAPAASAEVSRASPADAGRRADPECGEDLNPKGD